MWEFYKIIVHDVKIKILCFKTLDAWYHQILSESREICVHKLHWLRWILDACDIQTLKKVKVSLLQIFWKCAAVTEFKMCLLVCRVWLTLAAQTEVGFFQASIHSFMPNETAFASGLSFASFPGSPLHPSFFLDAQSSVKGAAQVTGQWALHLWTSNCHYILIQ